MFVKLPKIAGEVWYLGGLLAMIFATFPLYSFVNADLVAYGNALKKLDRSAGHELAGDVQRLAELLVGRPDRIAALAGRMAEAGQVPGSAFLFRQIWEAGHRSPDVAVGYASVLWNLGDAPAALNVLEDTVGDDAGENLRFVELKSGLLLANRRPADALALIDGLPVSTISTNETKARALAELGRPLEAASVFADLLTAQPKNMGWRLDYARLLRDAGRPWQAIHEFRSILDESNSSKEVRLELAWLLHSEGAAAEAISVLQDAPESDASEDLKLLGFKASLLMENQQPADALTTLDNIAQPSKNIIETKAWALAELDRHLEAALLFKELLADEPGNQSWRLNYARLLRDSGQVEEAIKEFRLLLDDENNAASSEVRLELAWLLHSESRYDEALAVFEEMPPHEMTNEIRKTRAGLLERSKRFSEAAAIYQEMLDQAPEDHFARLRLAEILSWNRDYTAALAHYELLLQASPADRQLMRQYARILGWAGRNQEAARLWERSLQ